MLVVYHPDRDVATGRIHVDTRAAPNGTSGNFIFDAVEVSPNDIWAVGQGKRASSSESALALDWKGTAWTIRLPVSNGYDELLSVDASGPNHVWAEGRMFVQYSPPACDGSTGTGGDWYGWIEQLDADLRVGVAPDPIGVGAATPGAPDLYRPAMDPRSMRSA
jgi:hypothetical protein